MLVNLSLDSNLSKTIDLLSSDFFVVDNSSDLIDIYLSKVSHNNFSLTNDTTQEPSKGNCILFDFILYSIVAMTIGFAGLIGNTVSFLVLHQDKCTPTASLMLRSLAITDNIFLALWMLHYSLRFALKYGGIQLQDSSIWVIIRVYTFPLLYMAQMITIWLTVVISFNRFVAVCLPYKAPSFCNVKNVYKEIAVVVIAALVYNIPKFFEIEIERNAESQSFRGKRTALGGNEMYRFIYGDIFYHTTTFVIPLFMLIIMNTRVIIVYKETRKRKRRMTSRRSENENNITLIMIIVIIIFLSCHTPARLVQIILSYSFNHCKEYSYYLIHFSNVLEVLNSSVNFIVYFVFRKSFRDIICGHLSCSVNNLNNRMNRRSCLQTDRFSLAQFETTCPTFLSTTNGVNHDAADEQKFHSNNDIPNGQETTLIGKNNSTSNEENKEKTSLTENS